ncbi:long-chain fatty acid--CoA ligase [Streptomyces piniterrae]|uniref:Long-chain fatty acid--CoA ligase n=2 Tax=Streptomyces piniterrae TaxID=2571125 RepID=A0A4U0MUF0_9ACTN|nr:AMP-dependent synthetase/ligase [Streptomyces piniterrae]TJZ44661.1 long-chain fatty acid--CoA ligase [Streptomyces piniterrae]
MGSIGTDLRTAGRRPELAGRVTVELIREGGVVREVRADPLVTTPGDGSLADIPFTNAAEAPRHVVVRRKTDGRWQPVTAAEFARQVGAVARGLVAAGLAPGDRVALMSQTRYEWTVLDFAIWAAGGLSVPIYPTASAEQVRWILHDSAAVFFIVETAEDARTARNAMAGLDHSRRIWQIDDGALDELARIGREISDRVLTARRRALGPDSIATLVYTSGTTGMPKGCVLTHGNLHAEAANLVQLLRPVFVEATRQTPATLLFLPLAHILGRAIQVACLLDRITIGLWPSITPEELRPELAAFRPTFLVAVPYFFEKVHDTARETADRMGRAASFVRAERIAVRYGERQHHRMLGTGRGPGLGLRLAKRLYDLLVYRRVRKALGGRLRYAISGSSSLDPRLGMFFFGCGILIYEGYGLTETTAAATLAPPLAPRPKTVGLPVPGTAVRIADDGEVLVKGPIVFGAYWNNPAAAQAMLSGGWLATGDLGRLDDDGYLSIVGRKKDILITSGGKNVSPALLEDRLRGRPPIGQCMVVGEGRHFVGALIALDAEAMAHWLWVRGRPIDTPFSQLREDPELLADIQQAVEHANQAASQAESIRAFRLVDGAFTQQNGLLTPSLKMRRHAVAAAYADEIEALYGGSRGETRNGEALHSGLHGGPRGGLLGDRNSRRSGR